jgi:Protein of unknown function (DUF2899).
MIIEIAEHAIMIAGFVFVMMLVIEYINIQTKGSWQNVIMRHQWLQYVFSAFLGFIPGCLGAFTTVALFTHNIISFGALSAAMIATFGDEAFIMLAMFPDKALLLMFITFFLGIGVGITVDKISPHITIFNKIAHRKLPLHNQDNCHCFDIHQFWQQLQKPILPRIILILTVLLLLSGVFLGFIAPEEQRWIRVTIIVTSFCALFVVFTVPDHFLKEHLWNHIVKIHIPKILLWTVAALVVIHILLNVLHIEDWIQQNMLMILLIACLVGLIPESGPHLLFVTLFAAGKIPFSVLLASSIVQDGHGMIPLLAESKRGFLLVKAINLLVGLIVGMLVYSIGF